MKQFTITKPPDKVKITIRAEKDLLDEIDRVANATETTKSHVIREATKIGLRYINY